MRKAAVVGAIAVTLLSSILIDGGFPTWRVGIVALLFTIMISAQAITVRHVERHPERIDLAVIGLHTLSQFYLMGCVAATGGLRSPMLPALGSATALPFVFFGPHSTSRRLTCLLVLLFIAVALLPSSWLGPVLPHGHFAGAATVSFVWTVIVVSLFVGKIHEATVQATTAVDRLNEEQVAATAEHLCRMQSVGSRVAHELKNPLASIKGLVQLLARSTDSPKNQERLEVMQGEIARMETILREYLSFSRPLEELKPQGVDVGLLISDAASVIAGRAEQARITVTIDARSVRIDADPRRLKEALLNLLANAIEATPAGGMIALATRATDDGAAIEVRDSGRGIKPEDLERLATPFFTTRDGGTGLGVVLAQNVVAQHGGTLHYASTPGRGTVVTIRLPRTPAPPPAGTVLTTSVLRPLEPAA